MDCEGCPYKGQPKVYGGGYTTDGKKIVFIKEERHFDVMAIGMAPAKEELSSGHVFVGASGQILRRELLKMGVKEYYLCNCLLCEITDETYQSEAAEHCKEGLFEEIKRVNPKLIIALGDLPLHILADTEYKIKEVEGRVIPSRLGYPMLPLTHPAYYWYHPDQFYDFLECLRPGIRFLENKYFQADDPTLEVVTHQTMGKVKEKLSHYEELAVDTETTGFFAHGWEPDTLLEMGVAGEDNHAYIIPAPLIPEFKDILEEKKCIFWNAQFDCGFLKVIGITPNNYFDGMLAHYTIDERPYSHGLKAVAQRYLGCDNWEKEIDKYIPGRKKKDVSYSVIPTDIRYTYLSKDVTRTLMLRKALDPELNKKVFWDMLMPASRMFTEIQHKGMRIDPVKMMEMEPVLQEDMDRTQAEIEEITGEYINPNSSLQVKHLIYDIMKLPADPYYGLSTSKGALEPFMDDPVIEKIVSYRALSKLKNGYLGQFAKHTDRNFRVHPAIKLFGAITGRLSSENPSIMNIKSDSQLKTIFLPEPGEYLGYGDISGNELRCYCVISGDPELTSILRNGGDPHEVVRMAAYGPEPDEDRKRYLRMLAKAVVFGRIYKRGVESIERQVGSGAIDAVMKAVDGVAPSIGKYYQQTLKELRAQGYLTSYFGRRRQWGLITPDTKSGIEREAVNFKPQSMGSDIMLLNFLHLWEMKDKWGIWPFWPYHDSITMNDPEPKNLPDIKKELESYSLELVHGEMPFVWKMDFGRNWALHKYSEE